MAKKGDKGWEKQQREQQFQALQRKQRLADLLGATPKIKMAQEHEWTKKKMDDLFAQVMAPTPRGTFFYDAYVQQKPPQPLQPPGGGQNQMARKFKNGATVRYIGPDSNLREKEAVGVVIGYHNFNGYAVDFDESIPPGELRGLHDADGLVPSGRGWWCDSNHLEPGELKQPRPPVDFDSVVIADEKRQQILEALEQINQQELIFVKWAFGKTIEKGRGVSLLFYGPPGTGKTLMGQAIADKLGYKLSVLSTADIESSKPGEAERNIREAFKKAKDGKTILFFDECDSLIYSRSHVGPIMSAQVNELLSQLERFEGITIFTTNRLGTLDEAVNRRLALKLEFAMPTLDERAEIWKRMFPAEAPLDMDVDFKRLAVVELTGGYIKNAVLRAARMAAIEKKPDEEKRIKMGHLIKALKFEAESMVAFDKARQENEGNYGHVDHGVVRGRASEVKRSFGNG